MSRDGGRLNSAEHRYHRTIRSGRTVFSTCKTSHGHQDIPLAEKSKSTERDGPERLQWEEEVWGWVSVGRDDRYIHLPIRFALAPSMGLAQVGVL